jgi:rhamnosyl/mannosyltransferase
MRVLHIYKSYFPETIGGVEQVIHQIVKCGPKHGIYAEVFVMTNGRNTRTIEYDGYLVHRCHANVEIASTPISITAIRRFNSLAEDFDILHYHFPYPFADLMHLMSAINKPSIVTYHSDIVKQRYLLELYKPLMRRFLSDVDCIVATSPNYLESSDVLADFNQKTAVIPIGIDRDNYPEPSHEKLDYWRRRFGERFFLFVGVIRYYKGLHILIEAAQKTDYPIVIIGAGPIEVSLKSQVKTLGVTNVHFVGRLPDEDKVALLTLCYGVVFPSHLRSEAFGVSLLEGAMYGKPMISSEIGTGTTYINIADDTGLVVPPSDATALREAMDYLWDHPDVASEMGQRACKRYRELFTAEEMAESYEKLYRSLV